MQVPKGFSHQTTQLTFTCPHCGVMSLHQKLRDVPGSVDRRQLEILSGGTVAIEALHIHFIFQCVNCQKDTYLLYRQDFKSPTATTITLPDFPKAEFLYQYPVHTPTLYESVPSAVASAATEAERCLSVGAPNACGVMTRRAMHSLCEDKVAAGKNLFSQLKDLKDKQIITHDLHEWADSLRVLGNDGAHPELPAVTQGDAEDGVKLLREIVKFVYILPYERAQKRKAVP